MWRDSPVGKAMAICSGMPHTDGKDWPPLGVLWMPLYERWPGPLKRGQQGVNMIKVR